MVQAQLRSSCEGMVEILRFVRRPRLPLWVSLAAVYPSIASPAHLRSSAQVARALGCRYLEDEAIDVFGCLAQLAMRGQLSGCGSCCPGLGLPLPMFDSCSSLFWCQTSICFQISHASCSHRGPDEKSQVQLDQQPRTEHQHQHC